MAPDNRSAPNQTNQSDQVPRQSVLPAPKLQLVRAWIEYASSRRLPDRQPVNRRNARSSRPSGTSTLAPSFSAMNACARHRARGIQGPPVAISGVSSGSQLDIVASNANLAEAKSQAQSERRRPPSAFVTQWPIAESVTIAETVPGDDIEHKTRLQSQPQASSQGHSRYRVLSRH